MAVNTVNCHKCQQQPKQKDTKRLKVGKIYTRQIYAARKFFVCSRICSSCFLLLYCLPHGPLSPGYFALWLSDSGQWEALAEDKRTEGRGKTVISYRGSKTPRKRTPGGFFSLQLYFLWKAPPSVFLDSDGQLLPDRIFLWNMTSPHYSSSYRDSSIFLLLLTSRLPLWPVFVS